MPREDVQVSQRADRSDFRPAVDEGAEPAVLDGLGAKRIIVAVVSALIGGEGIAGQGDDTDRQQTERATTRPIGAISRAELRGPK